jgi:hypothetical protein
MQRNAPGRTRRTLFAAAAFIEAGAGLTLVGLPALGIWLLLGVREPSPEALIAGRVCGTAMLANGVACWFARDDHGSPSQRGLLWAMLVYNIGVCAVLAFGGLVSQMAGVGLWPVVGLHGVMTIWCARIAAVSERSPVTSEIHA